MALTDRVDVERPVPGFTFHAMTAAALTHYERLGGADGVRRLVDRFYDIMDTVPEAATIRALHAASLKSSREKLFLYLTGWTGGPQLYVEKYGHPALRMRHLPFPIGSKERDQWLWCMEHSLDEHDMPADLRELLREKLRSLADHMRNRPD
jgi:hemoglobin